jgi:hypothetical protein
MRSNHAGSITGRLIAISLPGLLIAAGLAGCNLQQQQSGGGSGGVSATAAPATPVIAPVGATPEGQTLATPEATSEATQEVTASETSVPDPVGDAIDQLLSQFDNLNTTADQMTDQP